MSGSGKEVWSIAQLNAYLAGQSGDKKPKKTNMFGSKEITIDGVTYQSLVEGKYAGYLSIRKRAGEIQDFYPHVIFYLKGNNTDEDGDDTLITTYTADFVVVENDDSFTVIDIKGTRATITAKFKLKAKMVLDQYGMEVICIDGQSKQPIKFMRKPKKKP